MMQAPLSFLLAMVAALLLSTGRLSPLVLCSVTTVNPVGPEGHLPLNSVTSTSDLHSNSSVFDIDIDANLEGGGSPASPSDLEAADAHTATVPPEPVVNPTSTDTEPPTPRPRPAPLQRSTAMRSLVPVMSPPSSVAIAPLEEDTAIQRGSRAAGNSTDAHDKDAI